MIGRCSPRCGKSADVILVGAGTVRTEGYAGARPTVAQRQRRQSRGQSEVPQLAIVSKSGHLERDMPVFTRTEVPPLVCTCTTAADQTRRTLAGLAEVVDCSIDDPDSVDSAAVLALLGDRGLPRVLTEGGPTLFSSFVERDLLDELCLTIAPTLVGGQAGRIATGPEQVHMGCAAHTSSPTTTATCTRATCGDRPDRSTNRYCGRHEQARRVHHLADRGDRGAGRLRARTGRQPAVRHQRRSPAAGQADEDETPNGPAPIAKPKNELSWHDCTAKEFSQAAAPAPAGVKLDCANYDADLDPVNGAAGSLSIGVVRARSTQTPDDAGPLVFTTGSDLPSSLQLPVWLARAGADVLRKHPIVAVDRRGMGTSSPVDCLEQFDRQEIHDQAQFEAGNDPVANLADIVQTSTTSCTDTIAPGDSAYDNTHAATDIERLRSIWDVPALALIGVGNGAQVALSYASSHPDKVARLILDSPVALGVGAEAAAEQRVKGQQAALDAFAGQCAAVNCPLGPDPKGAVSALLADAHAGHGPAGASVASIVSAISTSLGFPTGDRIGTTNELATALAAARNGDTNLLAGLITRAEGMRGTDGQFVNTCSDAVNRPTPDRIRELVVAWAKLYPQFGTVGALSLVKCVSWPSASPPQPPKKLTVNVLLMGVQRRPDRRVRRRLGHRCHHHQRHRRQQAGDVAGHRPRRQHLLVVRGPAAGRLPRQRHIAGHRHLLSRLILQSV